MDIGEWAMDLGTSKRNRYESRGSLRAKRPVWTLENGQWIWEQAKGIVLIRGVDVTMTKINVRFVKIQNPKP